MMVIDENLMCSFKVIKSKIDEWYKIIIEKCI
jgi:hypothetical protein